MFNLMIIHLLGLMTPGPDFFYVVRLSASRSRAESVAGIIGITLGVAFWAACAIFGLAILFSTMPILQGIIMFLGGSYLAYLGILMLRVKENTKFDSQGENKIAQGSVKKEMLKGLLVNLSNAKAILYFASVMSLVLVNLTSLWQIVIAFAIIIVETFFYFYLVSLLFSRPAVKQFYAQYNRYIDNLAGLIFFCFGAYLVYSGAIKGLALI